VARRRGVGLVLSILFLAVLASTIGMLVIIFLVGREPAVAPHSVLVLHVEGDLSEVPPENVFGTFVGRRKPTVRALVESLEKAAADPRISSVLVVPKGLDTPYWGKLQEVREAVTAFRRSGKRAIGYLEYGGER
jgi:protease-4